MSNKKLFNNHTVKAYDDEINNLEIMIYNMGSKSLEQIKNLNLVLQNNDHKLALEIVELDSEINNLNDLIEQKVIQVIALWQPLADDLRNILYSIKIAADMERMADHIKNVAKLCTNHDFNVKKYEHLIKNVYKMVNSLIIMLDSIISFKKEHSPDIDILYDVCKQDQRIDDTFDNIFEELVEFMNKKDNDKDNIDICMSLLFVIKNLERIGDLIVNIAQHFYYILTAKRISKLHQKEID